MISKKKSGFLRNIFCSQNLWTSPLFLQMHALHISRFANESLNIHGIYFTINDFGPLSRGHSHSSNVNHCVSTISFQKSLGGQNKIGSLRPGWVPSGAWTGNLLIWPTTSAIHQMVNLTGYVILWTILQNFISFFLWNQNKQRRWFMGWRSVYLVRLVCHTFYILIMGENL